MRAMPTPADRLRQLRIKKLFATAKDAALAYGWNENTYKSHESGVRGIKTDAAERYAQAFGSSAAFILTGAGGNSAPVSVVYHVPLVGTASAGNFREADNIVDGDLEIPIVPKKGVAPEVQYALKVEGPSVNLRIEDGAFAICCPLDKYPGGAQHGNLVHVIRDRHGLHEHSIKELRYLPKGAILVPCSSDPAFQEPLSLEGDEFTRIDIHGVVLGSYKPL